jgi:L-seryl-tRNA(Ser) seleniumtransferase
LSLTALASGREAIISRGELVEIGGGFRVPDVMAQSGAILREVGTTNRTRAADYAAAISEKTALILRVHPSNFRIEGFTERPTLQELAAIGRKFNVPVVEDIGSGYLGPPHLSAFLTARGAPPPRASARLADARSVPQPKIADTEPIVAESLAAGADVVMFSGDKLLGGPQAGIVAGTEAAIARIKTHPLMRALRVDKLTYAVLEATVALWADSRRRSDLPVYRMLTMPLDAIDRRARELMTFFTRSAGVTNTVIDGTSAVGGGSAPGSALPTRLVTVAVDGYSASALAAALRAGDPPVIARVQDDVVVIDVRTVAPDEMEELGKAINRLTMKQ